MKNWKGLTRNKKLVAGIVAGIVAIAILVLIIVLAGGSNSGNGGSTGSNSSVPGVSDNTTAPNVDPTDTLPDESTGGDETDPTDSAGNTDGTEETDPTDPGTPTDPTEDTEPDVTVPPVTEPTPTEPNVDDDDNWIPTEDPNATPTEGKTFDFSDVKKVEDLTYEEWNSWSFEKQGAFISDYKGGQTKWTDEEMHAFACMENNNYDCGCAGHWCTNKYQHAEAMAKINEGCEHCGKHDCVSLFSHNEWGGWDYDHTLCPEYNIKADPNRWCQYCDTICLECAQTGEEGCQRGLFADYECANCGETVYVGKCHHCIRKPGYCNDIIH